MESEDKGVKQPKKLTYKQKVIVSSHRLNASDWMLEKETEFYLYLVGKDGSKKKIIDKFKRG
ncbi:uncharacterized protein BN803_01980 [Firmicutes bacterium CAG:882]|nr:uncharacterized protein BN803_01980 [Firmicutes bacterium CAG:882]